MNATVAVATALKGCKGLKELKAKRVQWVHRDKKA